jgi:hypothetical protein
VTAFPSENQLELLKLPLLYALIVLLEAAIVTVYYRVSDARSAQAPLQVSLDR